MNVVLSKIVIGNEIGHKAVISRSHSQPASEVDWFFKKIKELLHQIKQPKSSFLVILGDFDVRYRSWFNNTTLNEGL